MLANLEVYKPVVCFDMEKLARALDPCISSDIFEDDDIVRRIADLSFANAGPERTGEDEDISRFESLLRGKQNPLSGPCDKIRQFTNDGSGILCH